MSSKSRGTSTTGFGMFTGTGKYSDVCTLFQKKEPTTCPKAPYYCDICDKYDQVKNPLDCDWCKRILFGESGLKRAQTSKQDESSTAETSGEEAPESVDAETEPIPSEVSEDGGSTIAEEGGANTVAETGVGSDYRNKAVSTASQCPVAAECIVLEYGDEESQSCPARAARSDANTERGGRRGGDGFRCSGTCTSWCTSRGV